MIRYYRLLPDYRTLNVEIQPRRSPPKTIKRNLRMKKGVPLSPPPEDPFTFDFEIDEDDMLPGEIWKLPDYSTVGPTMSLELIKTIQDVGVDNLEVYPAIFVNIGTGEEFNNWHAAVNVVGLVSCADLNQSKSQPLASKHYFHELKIDAKKAIGLFMFRLAEQPMDIILHEKVAEAIRSGQFDGLLLEEIT